MFNKWYPISILIFVSLIAGCASLSKEECLHADWYLIGYEDGTRGLRSTKLGDHREACAEYGIVPEQDQYLIGREKGLQEYCVPYNGYHQGIKGASYHGVCDADSEAGFLAAFNYGKKIYDLEQQLDEAQREKEQFEEELEDIRKSILEKESALISENTSATKRAELLRETKRLARRQGEIGSDALQLEREIAELNIRLSQLREEIPY